MSALFHFFIKIKISRKVYIILVKAAKNTLSTRQDKNTKHGRSNPSLSQAYYSKKIRAWFRCKLSLSKSDLFLAYMVAS